MKPPKINFLFFLFLTVICHPNVSDAGFINFSPSTFPFDVISNGALPPARFLSISNAEADAMNWTVSSDAGWLSLDPLTGVNSGNVSVSVTTSVLSAGSYTATITITSPDASNSPQTIPVSLFVYDAAAYLEDFESGNLASLPWITGGSGIWSVQSSTSFSGTYAAQSPSMGDTSMSYLEVSVNICSPGYVSFRVKTSTEPQWDNLTFRIDGSNFGKWDGWYGETDWTRVNSNFTVNPGLHTFRWEYSKDGSMSGGADAVWLDNIVFPFVTPPVKLLSRYFWAAQTAYNTAADGDVIQLQEYAFIENLDLNHNISATLKGGYDCNYDTYPRFATIKGMLTISDGTITVENIVIQ